MSTQKAYALLTAIQQRAASVLSAVTTSTGQAPQSLLLDLLNSNVETPDVRLFDLSRLLDGLSLDGLFGAVGSNVQGGQESDLLDLTNLDLSKLDFGGLKDFGHKLLAGDPLAVVRREFDDLRAGGGAAALPDAIRGIVGRQVGIGISFVTTLKNLASPGLPERVLEGWKKYFFAEGGYQTVDGIQIVAPGHAGQLDGLKAPDLTSAGLQQSLKGLRGLLSERSAEQYVRDLIRIVVEVGGDQRYRLPGRRDDLLKKVNDAAKAERWFKGAASMAESLVTSVVEEVSLGVAQFQTNPVLAAAAATYAGTAARKASQHVFLSEANVPV